MWRGKLSSAPDNNRDVLGTSKGTLPMRVVRCLFEKPKAIGIVRAFSTLLDAVIEISNQVNRAKFNKYEVVYNDC